MMPTFLRLLFRRIKNDKLISFIQFGSLIMANLAGILVLLFVLDEYSFDQFHDNKDRVFKVVTEISNANTGETTSKLETNAWPIGDLLEREYPEVESVLYGYRGSFLYVNQENEKIQENVHFMEEEFLDIFSFPVLAGNPKTALKEPYSIVLTDEIAEKYFGDENPLGKTLLMGDSLNMKVTGVVECPENSHIQFGILASFSTYKELNPSFSVTSEDGWGNFNMWNYILLNESSDQEAFKEKASKLFQEKAGDMAERLGVKVDIHFLPLHNLYLKSTYSNKLGPSGDIDKIQLISGIGVLIILLACINFINLSTARSVLRAKEVGLKKVIGSTKNKLVSQFLMESLIITILSFIIAIIITDSILPFYNLILGKNYHIASIFAPLTFSSLIGIIVLISILAGYYPALIISSFKPTDILKGIIHKGKKGIGLRRALVVIQFFICSGLIIGILLSKLQLDFMKSHNLGFNKDQLITLDLRSIHNLTVQRSYKNVLHELSQIPYISNITFTGAMPGRSGWNGQWCNVEGMEEKENLTVHYIPIDEHFIQTLEMELIGGRNFNIEKASDIDKGLIINEKIVELMEWESPEEAIGKQITSPSGYPAGEIIGVVKNYNQTGLQHEIQPIVFDHYTLVSKYIVLRYENNNPETVVSDIKKLWNNHYPEYDFNYFFVDEEFDNQYKTEERIMHITSLFTGIAIFIAIIGLIGLISYVVNVRQKELGIRRVLGAHSFRLTYNLIKEFLILILISNLLVFPFAWFYGNKWLDTFAYHDGFDLWIIVFTLLTTLIITLLTVGIKSLKASRTNPVEILRNE